MCGGTTIVSQDVRSGIGRVYPRVCGGTPSALPTAFARPSTVYPRVCGGTKIRRGLPVSASTRTVYPRVCGGTVPKGLSTCQSGRGSIPACAGEPSLTVHIVE